MIGTDKGKKPSKVGVLRLMRENNDLLAKSCQRPIGAIGAVS